MEEHNVTIVGWPKEPASLEHHFVLQEPCPISISFEKTPATVIVQTNPDQPLHVNMNMNISAREAIPLCIKVCEPICAQSDYTIGIDIFDRPVASIRVKGQTRFFNCREED